MQQVILTLALLFSSIIVAQTEVKPNFEEGKSITVSVVNALSDNGNIKFGLYSKESFRKESLISKSSIIENGIGKVVFENIPAGNYAIVCYHDENSNNRIDFHENGMPKENFGSSNNPMNYG